MAVLPAAVPDRATDFFGLGRVDGVSPIGMLRVVFALRSGHFTAFGRTLVRFPPAPALAVSQVDAAGIATRTRRWGLARRGWSGTWDFSQGPPASYHARLRVPGVQPGCTH